MEFISKKISLLNQTTLESLSDIDSAAIVEHFTEVGLKILEADFGFAWWNTSDNLRYRLIYKSPNTPYEPKMPREQGGNFEAKKTRSPLFVENIVKEDYEQAYDVSPYMKSYAIIPITYKESIYGNIVICYKEGHTFSEEEKQLAISLGNAAAQSITIHRLIEKEHKTALASAKHQADLKSEQLRTEFIANTTHEIRTPLAIIRGNADLALLNKKGVSVYARKVFKAINHEIDHLSNIITDLTILTSGGLIHRSINFSEKIDLSQVISSTAKRCSALANQKEISIKTKIEQNIYILGDQAYLEKLIINLIKNAVDYGKIHGKITINIATSGDLVIIDVKDNGIGISKEDLPHIFNRFYRANRIHNSGSNNTGLGLAIVSWVVHVHKGTIGVQSTLGKGTSFSIRLPRLKQG